MNLLFEIFSAAWADNMPQIVYVLFKIFSAEDKLAMDGIVS